ncbi:PREDICTED: uncharacterized protein LOC104774176 [Camelina sativa]|uniref:Uncharacterized protein LOC104774176 n=1 Tax=Camelina sativa TaxID=90675 RepID=A0ABM0Y8E2_CAMSA|nr:PREDICTED: uncharacterized protein LOC104774176 [Camelina sativa]
MAKNSQNSSSKKKQENRICEKIFRAVTSPVRTVRRISTKPSTSHPAEAVCVKFAETSSTQAAAAKPIITKMEPKKTVIARVETTIKTDERFTDYIKKAKLKIRAMTTNHDDDAWETSETDQTREHHHVHNSHVGGRSSGRSSSSDQFSEYIKKAKMKLMSSSTIARANPTNDTYFK